MKKKKLLLIALLISNLYAFKYSISTGPAPKGSPTQVVKENYVQNLQHFNQHVLQFHEIAKSYSNGEISTDEIQFAILELRSQYKRIEFLVDYFDPKTVAFYINGAPLPKLEEHVPEISVIPPSGLQTLDEIIFLDSEARDEIVDLSIKLKHNVEALVKYQLGQKIEHRYIIESLRYGILRVMTLGLTGFDTPGSVNAIPEAMISLQAMQNAFRSYEELSQGKATDEYVQIVELFNEAIKYVGENADFDSFDRLHFLRDFTQPLYATLYRFQKKMGIEFVDEVDPTLSAHNYHSEYIFDENFLNSSYYTEIAAVDLLDPKKIELGRTLFFDPVLSHDLSLSCASCHNPSKAFTDGLPLSASNTEGKFTRRNSPTLINSALYSRYFWDMREYDLERQIKHVISDSLEFNINFIDLSDRLKESEEYLALFKEAYGDRDKYDISSWSISNALASYVNSLTSFNSSFDQYVRSETQEIDESIKNGFNLFMGKAACGTCHFAPSFSGLVPPYYQDAESENLGITTKFDTLDPILDQDFGRMANGLTEESAEHFARSFKTVTVRNVALTGPYMHNGGFNTLEEVVHFYNKGGGAGMGLDVPYQTLPDAHLNLTETEMKDIVTFMKALTDTTGMNMRPVRLPSFEKRPEWNNRYVTTY